MPFISLFSAARFFRRFSHYKYFAQFPGPVLEGVLEELFAAELQVPARRQHFEGLSQGFARLLRRAEGVEVPTDPQAFVRRCEQHWNLDMVLLGLELGDDGYMAEALRLVDVEPAREAFARHGSAVFVVPHAGPHLLTPFVLAKYGFPTALTGGYEAEDTQGGLEIATFHNLPIDSGHALPLGADFHLRCLGALAGGLGLMVYPEYSKAARIGALRTSFLGARVHMPTGAARLALASQRPLIPLRWVSTGPHRYALRFGPVIEPEALKPAGAVEACMRTIFAELETQVRAQPENWEGWHYFDQMIANGAAEAA